MTVSKRLRFEILRRDNFTCRYCGATAPDAALTVDHVKPTALGGRDEPENLVACCRDCNAGKSSIPADAAIVADVAEDAARWARAVQLATAELVEIERELGLVHQAFDEEWLSWQYGDPPKTFPRVADWADTISTFVRYGLPQDVIVASVETAMAGRTHGEYGEWRYFCGVCWRKIDALLARAEEIVEELP